VELEWLSPKNVVPWLAVTAELPASVNATDVLVISSTAELVISTVDTLLAGTDMATDSPTEVSTALC
jgi:hypothetical protein